MDRVTEALTGSRRFDGLDATAAYLADIGVRHVQPRTTPFDPGYDLPSVEGHLEQSAHLMAGLKISMACWMVASEDVTRRKIESARRAGVPTVAGGGPFEIAVAQRALPAYLDLCAEVGLDRIECGEGFTDLAVTPAEVASQAASRGLEIEYELGEKHSGAFGEQQLAELIDRGKTWLEAGAKLIVVEARESARDVGLFGSEGKLAQAHADALADAFGMERLVFEAPSKPSQFALIDHFGPDVRLSNVRLEELLRVEIYRRGLHCDAFRSPALRPTSAT